MRLIEVEYAGEKMLVLCIRSEVKENFSYHGFLVGKNILTHKSKFIGLARDKKDAYLKYPEYFL